MEQDEKETKEGTNELTKCTKASAGLLVASLSLSCEFHALQVERRAKRQKGEVLNW